MSKERVLEYCRYWNDGKCQYHKEFKEKLETLEASGLGIAALQPRCPIDAQRNKRGLLCCVLERRDKLC